MFEYKIVQFEEKTTLNKFLFKLNTLGRSNWELCGSEFGWMIFKRAIPDWAWPESLEDSSQLSRKKD
jgi:hypothetical protein